MTITKGPEDGIIINGMLMDLINAIKYNTLTFFQFLSTTSAIFLASKTRPELI